jgi:hypothetical protein
MKSMIPVLMLIVINLLTACSTTATSSQAALQLHDLTNVSSPKKQFSSDQQLLLSLLNRPMTEDMQMMQAFATQQLGDTPFNRVNYVSIRGAKGTDQTARQQTSALWQLVYTDSHSVAIQGAE